MFSVWLFIIIANVIISYKGFNDFSFMSNYMLRVKELSVDKDYKRLITSGFLHANTTHLLFNMLTLYFFAGSLEDFTGGTKFFLIYMASLIGGNLLAWKIHENDYSYAAIGASGAVNGIVFSTIALIPGMKLYLLFIPIPIPAWFYAIAYILYSIYGMNKNSDNIGHEAHLGGALVGTLVTVLLYPYALKNNGLTIALIVIPIFIGLYIMIKNPGLIDKAQDIAVSNFFRKKIDQKENSNQNTVHKSTEKPSINSRKDIDRILDKISEKGVESLTEEEKRQLEEYGKY